MDWLLGRQDAHRGRRWPARHLAPAVNPARMALFDLSSSWVEGTHCPLAARGLLPRRQEGQAADRVRAAHRPRRAPGRGPGVRRATPPTRPRSSTPSTMVRDKFGLTELVLVGDRGMITSARIEALREHGRPGLAHRAARPGDRRAGRRGRAAAADPVRPAGPGRDHPPRLPRRTADRLPQPAAGRRTGPQTRRAAGRHRGRCWPRSLAAVAAGPAGRRGPDRAQGRAR